MLLNSFQLLTIQKLTLINGDSQDALFKEKSTKNKFVQ